MKGRILTVKTKRTLILCAAMLAVLATLLLSCGAPKTTDELWTDAIYTENTELGKGETTLTVEFVAGEKKIVFTLHTNEKTVGEALEALGIVEGEEGQFGLYIKKANGITADYDIDQSYWSFYENGALAMTGAHLTEIKDGVIYKLEYTK